MALDVVALGNPSGEADRAAIPSAAEGYPTAMRNACDAVASLRIRNRGGQPSRRRVSTTERPHKPSPCLEEAGRKARLFLRAHRTSLQRELGSRNRVSVTNPATRSRGPRGAVRPARRSTTKASRAGPEGALAHEGPPQGGRRSPLRHASPTRTRSGGYLPLDRARAPRGLATAVRRRRDEGWLNASLRQSRSECLSISGLRANSGQPRSRPNQRPTRSARQFLSNDRSRLLAAPNGRSIQWRK
jgi:hypothetical protein